MLSDIFFLNVSSHLERAGSLLSLAWARADELGSQQAERSPDCPYGVAVLLQATWSLRTHLLWLLGVEFMEYAGSPAVWRA